MKMSFQRFFSQFFRLKICFKIQLFRGLWLVIGSVMMEFGLGPKIGLICLLNRSILCFIFKILKIM